MRKSRAANLEKFRERERKRITVKSEKYYARKELNCAIKKGTINKASRCEECGKTTKLAGHHDDYSQPLKVRWLCYECHGKLHRKTS